ncbi:hypothetical protein CP082626L3_0174B, partial [Chlamydia psittaci 08-2626_L3]
SEQVFLCLNEVSRTLII